MLKLYYTPKTRASRPRWTLEELGVPYDLVQLDLHRGEHRKPDYLKVHPLGVVPALVDDTDVVLESGAICVYLAEKFPEKNLGPTAADRGKYYQWCFFLFGTLEPPLMDYFLHTARLPENERVPAVAARGREALARVLDFLDISLGEQSFLLGERFSVADVLIGGSLMWIASMQLLDPHPRLLDYARRLGSRPAYQRSIAEAQA